MAIIPKTYQDAEVGLLGSLLLDAPACAADVFLTLSAEDFKSAACRSVYEAARALYDEGSPVDPITVKARAGDAYREFVQEIVTVTPTAAHWRGYLDALKQCSILYCAQEIAQDIATGAAIEAEPEKLQARAEELLSVLSETGSANREFSLSELVTDFLLRLGKPRDYLDWGFPRLNEHLFCGAGSYILLAARPSVGKTALALQLAVHFAGKGKKTVFFSYETDKEKSADRIMSAQAFVPFRAINQDSVPPEKIASLPAAAKRLSGKPLTLVEASGMTFRELRARALRHRAEIVIVDYLQLIDYKNRRLSEYERVTDISREIQRFCKRYKVTVIALSQLSRIEENAEPSLTHLRSSGQLEQDADAALFLYRPPNDPGEGPEEREDIENRRVLKIAKNKNGRIGKIKLWFHGDYQTFTEQWERFYDLPDVPWNDENLGLADPEQKRQTVLEFNSIKGAKK